MALHFSGHQYIVQCPQVKKLWDDKEICVRELSPSAFPPVGGKQYIPFKNWSERGAIARKHCHKAHHTPLVVIDLEVSAEQYLYLEFHGLIEWDAAHEGWRCFLAMPLKLFRGVIHDHEETASWEAESFSATY